MPYTKLSNLAHQVMCSWEDRHKFFPNSLFHYTSSEGLIGIITSKSFWMTELRYMNDLSELQYARDLVQSYLNSILSSRTDLSSVQKSFLERVTSVDAFVGDVHIYSTSFCEHGNLLGQWG